MMDGRSLNPIFKKIKKDVSLFEEVLLAGGNAQEYKLTMSARRSAEEKEEFLLYQYQNFERYVHWFLGKTIFKDHRNRLDNHKDYVLIDIMKLKSMSVINYLSRVSYMYEIVPYLQAPTDEGDTAAEADFEILADEVDPKILRRAQYNGLPKYFQNALEDCRIKWRTLTDSDWHDELVAIERKEQRELHEAKVKKRKSTEGVSTPSGNTGSANKQQSKTPGKKGNSAGTGGDAQQKGPKSCFLCQGAGLPEKVYKSHKPSDCKNKEKYTTTRQSVENANVKESLRRVFCAAKRPEDVVNFIRMMDPSVEDTYLARRLPLYRDGDGRPELQSTYPVAYDEDNMDFDNNPSQKPSADDDGHY